MSLEKIQKAVEEFLSSDAPEVLSIKGAWGVGKTFFWNYLIKSHRKDQQYIFQRYAYVSMFGISSLDELKFSIFEQTVNKSQIGESISVDNLKQNTLDLARRLGRKASLFLQALPWVKNIVPAVNSAAFLSIKDMLICLDDFERKGDKLSAKDVLGMVSYLKEQRNCKVVLIFNDSKLEGIDVGDYKKFREKVIDVEVTFNIDSNDATSLAFSNNSQLQDSIGDLSKKLGINNIRILRKIERAARSVERLLRPYENEVLQQALQTLTLLGWCFYSNEKFYEYLKTRIDIYRFGEEKNKTKEEKEWDSILRDYGFGYLDDFDLALATIIETGYVDEVSILKEAENFNARVIANKSRDSIAKAWGLFRDTFKNNEEELVNAFELAIKANAEYISQGVLDGTVRLLRDLGKDAIASELIDFYIEKNQSRLELLDLDNYLFPEKIKDSELITKFRSKFRDIKKIKTLEDVLEKISGKDSWGRSDEEVLFAAPEDDFYKIFKKKEGSDLGSYIDACLRFGKFQNASEQQKAIAEKARKALIKIGKENNLNRLRVEAYEVSIEDN